MDIRTEILNFYLFRTLNEALEITKPNMTEHNSERPHESLNNLTPEQQWLKKRKSQKLHGPEQTCLHSRAEDLNVVIFRQRLHELQPHGEVR
ncbi:transposase [Erwinia sp. S43]|nr:transposase [Erwinia sp. S43]